MISENTAGVTQSLLTQPGKGHQTLLTTFRRNGQGVSTQVGTVSANGRLYFMTAANTWKVKRIANDPQVTLAPCTGRGQASGPAIHGTARRLYGDEMKQARALLRVGIMGHIWSFIFDLRNPGDKTAVFEIELVNEHEDYTRANRSLA